MKRVVILFVSLFMIISFTSCEPIVVKKFGMDFFSQTEMIQIALSIDLGDLTDKNIKDIHSHTDENGNELTIKYIDLDGAGDIFEKGIVNNENWQQLPYNSKIQELLKASNAHEQYDFTNIKEGYYTISGVSSSQKEFDFDFNNFEKWYGFQIGIWDSNAETLYYISITDTSKS